MEGTLKKEPFPSTKVPYDWIDYPFLDSTLEYQKTYTPLGNASNFEFTVELGQELLGWETYQYYFGNERALNSWRGRGVRRSEKNEILGPLRLSEVEVLDISTPTLPSISSAKAGRGISVSSYPLNQPQNFGFHSFDGLLPRDWELEIYRNNIFLQKITGTDSGAFLIPDILLQYGKNDFRLSYFGPRGERRDEYRTFLLDSSLIPPGKTYFRSTWVKENNSQQTSFTGQAEHGLSRYLSIGVNTFLPTNFIESRIQYLGLSLNTSLERVLTQFNFVSASNGSKLVNTTFHSALGPVATSLNYYKLFDYSNEIFPLERGTSISHQISANLYTSIPTHPAIGTTADYTFREFSDHMNSHQARASFATLISPIFLNNSFIFSSNRNPNLSGKLDLGHQFTLLSSGAIFEYNTSYLNAIELFVRRSDPEFISMNLNYRRELRSKNDTYRAGFSKQFSICTASLDFSSINWSSYEVGLRLSFSLVPIPNIPSWNLGPQSNVPLGAALISVYKDSNHNQIQDSNEIGLDKILLNVNGKQENAVTDKMGHSLLKRLPPYRPTEVSIAAKSLTDPFLRPATKGISFVPRPSKTALIQIPMAVFGDLEGKVSDLETGVHIPFGTLVAELMTLDGKSIQKREIMGDGYYQFEAVPPGKYTIRISRDSMLPESSAKLISIPPLHSVEMPENGDFIANLDFKVAPEAK